jgi:hypothetical protein
MVPLRVHQLDQRHPTNEVNPTATVSSQSPTVNFTNRQSQTVMEFVNSPAQWNGLKEATANRLLFFMEQQTQRLSTLIVAKRPQRNLSAENGSSELTKPSAEGNDGRSQSHILVIPHSNCFTSVFFPAFRVSSAVSAASNDSRVNDQPTLKKLTTQSRNHLQLTVQAPHSLCRDPVLRHVRPVCAISSRRSPAQCRWDKSWIEERGQSIELCEPHLNATTPLKKCVIIIFACMRSFKNAAMSHIITYSQYTES